MRGREKNMFNNNEKRIKELEQKIDKIQTGRESLLIGADKQ